MIRIRSIALVGVISMVLGPLRGAGAEEGAEGEQGSGASSFAWGTFSESYRARASVVDGESPVDGDAYLPAPTEGEQDNDLRLLMDGGYTSADGHFYLSGSFALWYDVDGVPDEDVTAFGSVYDTPQPWVNLMSLVAEYRAGEDLAVLRAGRLTTDIGLPATYDGASVTVLPGKGRIRLLAFGGRSVHFFETDADLLEDWMASVGVAVDLRPSLKLKADYRFTSEVVSTDVDARASTTDHTYGISLLARPRQWVMGRVWVRGLGAALSHAGLKGRILSPATDVGLDVSLETQLVELDEVNEQLDPYYAVLGSSNPNARWALDAWKQVDFSSGVARVHGGWNGRKVLQGDEGPFNRSMGRLYLLADGAELFGTGLGVGGAVEWHYAGVSDSGTQRRLLTGSGWVDYVTGGWRVRAGTDYQSFKYDYYEDIQELESVRTWYAGLTWAPRDWVRAGLRYAFERSDRDFHTVSLNLTQRF